MNNIYIILILVLVCLLFYLYNNNEQEPFTTTTLSEQSINAIQQCGNTYADSKNSANFKNILVTNNVTGNLKGNVTGNVTGDVTGDVTGNVTGDVTGSLISNNYKFNIDKNGNFNLNDISGNSIQKSWQYIGCYNDCKSGTNTSNVAGDERTLPAYYGNQQLIDCLTFAQNNGYTYAALQYGGECFAGTSENNPTQFGKVFACPVMGGPCTNQVYQYKTK
jgi:hypothetical protein